MARLLCALFPLLAVLAAAGLNALSQHPWARAAVAVVSVAWVAYLSWPYLCGFRLDATAQSTRLLAGQWLNQNVPTGASVQIPSSPAPYKCPPFAFGRYELKTNPNASAEYVVTVGTPLESIDYKLECQEEGPSRDTPLSFADQPVFVYRRATK